MSRANYRDGTCVRYHQEVRECIAIGYVDIDGFGGTVS